MRTIFIFLVTTSVMLAQVEARKPVNAFDLPVFYVDALSFASGDSITSRVDVYIQIPYDAIQFVKKNDRYVAQYEVTMNFMTDDNASVSEKVWTEEVKVPAFEYTESKRAFSLTQRSTNISPGIYTLRTQVRDNESKKVFHVIKKIIVGNYTAKHMSVSDIMLVNKISSDGDRRSIAPNVSGNIAEGNTSFSVFFEIYTSRSTDSVEVRYSILDGKGKELLNKLQNLRTHGSRSQVFMRFDSTGYNSGTYLMNVEVRSLTENNDDVQILRQRSFNVHHGNLPLSISDLDLAIKQMRYIAKSEEVEKIDAAVTEDAKRSLFDEFWLKRDPNPATKRNEYMEEYYSRVEYANQNFSHYQAGWKTDMGMVFILFGSPNNVERHPFDIDSKPYEVWSYYDYNRSLVFVDESGFGDYRLLTPIWDMLQRIKSNQ